MTSESTVPDSRIPCYVMAFYELECIRRTLESLRPLQDRLSLHVVENFSEHSESAIGPYLQDCVNQGAIASWVQYAENISNNALLDVLERNHGSWQTSPWVVLTDGDLECPAGWLDETLRILTAHPDLFACAVDLRTDNLPLNTFPEAAGWVPPAIAEKEDYLEGTTGVHFLTLRTESLRKFLKFRREQGVPFVDSAMHRFCYQQCRQRWARTRRHQAWHITWSLYSDPHHPYTQLKLRLTEQGNCWNHQRVAAARVTTREGVVNWDENRSLFPGAMKRWWQVWT